MTTIDNRRSQRWDEGAAANARKVSLCVDTVACSGLPRTVRLVPVVHEGLVVRLDVTNVERSFLAGCAGAGRVAYNFTVEKLRANQELWSAEREAGVEPANRTKTLTAIDVQQMWHAEKAVRYPWHARYPSKLYLFAIRQAVAAHKSWMAGKTGFPRFKKRASIAAFKVCETIGLWPGALLLPKLGRVRILAADARQKKTRRLIRSGKARVVSAAVRRDACDGWSASLTIARTVPERPPVPVPARIVGCDLGVKTLVVAVDTSGHEALVALPSKPLGKAQRRLAKRQRVVARKDRCHTKAAGAPGPRRSPSNKRAKAQAAVARTHRKVARQRGTRLHQTTRALTNLGVTLVIEDLNVKGMLAGGGAHKKGLNRHISDAGFAELRRQLTYKMPTGHLLVAPRFYASSKICSNCGIKNQDLQLGHRIWTCNSCGTRHDRDVNAATNLAAWGQALLEQTRAGYRRGAGPSVEATRHARRRDTPTPDTPGVCETGPVPVEATGTRQPDAHASGPSLGRN